MDEFIKLLETQPDGSSLDLWHILINLAVSLILGWILSLAYATTRKGCSERQAMIHTLVLLTMTIAVAMMIIGNNLARAFGLVGAVSIIRFRTAVKNSRDMAFVFIAIVVGMSSGLGFSFLAIIATVFFVVALLVLEKTRFGHQSISDQWYSLKMVWGNGDDPRAIVLKSITSMKIEWRLSTFKTGLKNFTVIYSLLISKKDDPVKILDTIQKELCATYPTVKCTLKYERHDEE